METFAIECDDPSGLEGLAGDPDLALFEALSLRLRWWQPLAPLVALLREGPWRALRSFELALNVRLPLEVFASVCAPEAPELLELDLDLPVDDAALGVLVGDVRLAKLRKLRLYRAELGAAGLRALADAGATRGLDEFVALGGSLGAGDVRALLDAGFRPGASVVLDVHGRPEDRLALTQEAEASGLNLLLFGHEAPRPLGLVAPFAWLEPCDAMSLALDDPLCRRLFVEMPYEHPATSLELRMHDPGALAGLDWGHHYPRLARLRVASSERGPLSADDIAAIASWRLPATLRELDLRPHRWCRRGEYLPSFGAAERIIGQLDRPPGSTVWFSDFPDSMNPGSCDLAVRALQRPHCRVYCRY